MRIRIIPIALYPYWLRQEGRLAKAKLDLLFNVPRLRRKFLNRHGYPLRLDAPQTFPEKIQWRKLYDNNPLFPVLSNKLLVRKYICKCLGQAEADLILVPLLYDTEEPNTIDFSRLPNQFALKATHGSGLNLIVTDKSRIDCEETRLLMHRWILTKYGVTKHEWIYSKTRPGIIIEELIAAPDELIDVKLYFFNGRMHCFVVIDHTDGFIRQTYFNAYGETINVKRRDRQHDLNAIAPKNLDLLTSIGEKLASGLDFVRVDFMCAPGRMYLGELSLLPGSGLNPVSPASFYEELGTAWVLPNAKSQILIS